MSAQATTAVWKHSSATPADLLVLLAIADSANPDGRRAAPGLPRLTQYTRKKKRAVMAAIERLLEAGELRRVGEGFRGSYAEFEIVLPGLVTFDKDAADDTLSDPDKGAGNDTQSNPERVQHPAPNEPEKDAADDTHSENERVHASARKGARQRTKGCTDATSAPLIRTNEPFNQHTRFEVFWNRYPARNGKKLEKAKAERAWDRLSESHRLAAMSGVQNYRDACDRNMTIARDAFRWLRDRAFDDWQTPAVPTSNGHEPYRNPPDSEYTEEIL